MIEYDITVILANVAIGIGLGVGLVALWVWRTVRRFENDMQGLVRAAIQEAEADMVGIVVEEDAGQLYFYRETDQQFLCQGPSLIEVRKAFNQQYPEKIAYLAGGDPALIERLRAELVLIKHKEDNENSLSV